MVKMGQNSVFSMLKSTLAQKCTPPPVMAVVTNMSYAYLFGSIKKLLRRNIKQMSSLIFALEHSLKTRPLNVGARRATSICYQCNEGPFSWNQCDHMSLQPFPILLLMMNIAHLLLQKENQKEDRVVGIPLLVTILFEKGRAYLGT